MTNTVLNLSNFKQAREQQQLVLSFATMANEPLSILEKNLYFYEQEIYIGSILESVSQSLQIPVDQIHLFIDSKSLQIDIFSATQKIAPATPAHLRTLLDGGKTPRMEKFCDMVDSEFAVVDKSDTLLYDRICNIDESFSEFVQSRDTTSVVVKVLFERDSEDEALNQILFRHYKSFVAPSTMPSEFIDAGVSTLLQELWVNRMRWELTETSLGVVFDLPLFYASFSLDHDTPIVQMITNTNGNVMRDITNSETRVLKEFTTAKNVDILNKWYSLTKKIGPIYYEKRSSVVLLQSPKYIERGIYMTIVLLSDGSSYADFSMASPKSVSYADFIAIVREEVNSSSGHVVSVIQRFLQQLKRWNAGLLDVSSNLFFSENNISFEFSAPKNFLDKETFSALVERYPTHITKGNSVLHKRVFESPNHPILQSMTYTRVNNYENKLDFSIILYVNQVLGESHLSAENVDSVVGYLVETLSIKNEDAQQAVQGFLRRQGLADTQSAGETSKKWLLPDLLARVGVGQVNDGIHIGFSQESSNRFTYDFLSTLSKEQIETANENVSGSGRNNRKKRVPPVTAANSEPGKVEKKKRVVLEPAWKPLSELQTVNSLYRNVGEKGEKGYSTYCQSGQGRVPIVFKSQTDFETMATKLSKYFPEQLVQEILRGDSDFYGSYMNYKGGPREGGEAPEENAPAIKPKKNSSLDNGYALKHKGAFFICPEAYCIRDHVPLLLRQLVDLSIRGPDGQEISLLELKKLKGKQKKFTVYGRCPICGGSVIERGSSKEKGQGDTNATVYINPMVNGRKGYPGFLKSTEHLPLDQRMVCCFSQSQADSLKREDSVDGVDVYSATAVSTTHRKKQRPDTKILITSKPYQYCKPDNYGVLAAPLYLWFNRLGLSRYGSIHGLISSETVQKYQQYLRLGVGWSPGMLTNLADVLYLLLPIPNKTAPLLTSGAAKVAATVEYLKQLPSFANNFYKADGGSVANVFSQTNQDPVSIFLNYLSCSKAWNDDIVLKVLSFQNIFDKPVTFVTFEAVDPPFFVTRDAEKNPRFTVKSSCDDYTGSRIYIFLQKTRVLRQKENQRSELHLVRGGYFYEIISFVSISPSSGITEKRLFELNHPFSSTNGHTENIQGIVDGLARLRSAQSLLPKKYFLDAKDVFQRSADTGLFRVEAQLLDVFYRCTHLLVTLSENLGPQPMTMWLPVYPQNPIETSGGKLFPAYNFWIKKDMFEMYNLSMDARSTREILHRLSTVFPDIWPYHESKGIAREFSMDNKTQSLTGLQLNAFAFTFVGKVLLDEPLEIDMHYTLSVVDNFLYDFFIVDPIKVYDSPEYLYIQQLQKDYDTKLLRHYFAAYVQSQVSQGKPVDFVSFATTVPWVDQAAPLKTNPQPFQGRDIDCLSIYNKSLLKMVYKEYTENEYYRHLYENNKILWPKPIPSKQTDECLVFFFYEWKNKIVDYLVDKVYENIIDCS